MNSFENYEEMKHPHNSPEDIDDSNIKNSVPLLHQRFKEIKAFISDIEKNRYDILKNFHLDTTKKIMGELEKKVNTDSTSPNEEKITPIHSSLLEDRLGNFVGGLGAFEKIANGDASEARIMTYKGFVGKFNDEISIILQDKNRYKEYLTTTQLNSTPSGTIH